MLKRVVAMFGMLLLACLPALAHCQGSVPAVRPETSFTPEQQQKLDAANRLFQSGQYADALRNYKELLGEVPVSDPHHNLLAKFASESALNIGENGFVLEALLPVVTADPNDWQP